MNGGEEWTFGGRGPTVSSLDAARCREVLGAGGVGRVVFTQNSLPAVVTMNYVVHASQIYFRTAAGTALARSVDGAVVAFNVDSQEPPWLSQSDTPGGWSVTVTGRCRRVDDPPLTVRERLLAWAPGARAEFFATDLALLSVERIRAPHGGA